MDPVALALEFLNYSNRHVYLTGKAGTGKTTFLRKLSENCHKSFIVVAPTGVAALNAGGVTIHSQFLFPLGPFLPEGSALEHHDLGFFDRRALSTRHPINNVRRQVLQGISLLVIDEVSMCRADILDAIDLRLRQARRVQKPFGGVQLLLIGDLYQLPPIVKDAEWGVLSKFYSSLHFFNSRALQAAGFVQIELQKVYRQQDAVFLELLNKIREQSLNSSDLELINQRVLSPPQDEPIHLLTHRNQAHKINQDRLEALPGQSYVYSAQVKDDFPERMYPVEENLSLKLGAKVMFLKNDSEEGKYFNGKIAEVIDLEEDAIWVKMEDEERYQVPKFTWKNSRYKLEESKQSLQEELLGQFSQYPLRLAWAITIHKSQGLTFDQAVVNLGRAFAPGQAYVALTRLRSMSGLYLSAPLSLNALITDLTAKEFHQQQSLLPAENSLDEAKKNYQFDLWQKTFDWNPLAYAFQDFYQTEYQRLQLKKTGFGERFKEIEEGIKEHQAVSRKFQSQIFKLATSGSKADFKLRLFKGRQYFLPLLRELLLELQNLKLEYANLSRTKTLVESFGSLIQNGFELYLGMYIFEVSWDFYQEGGNQNPDQALLERREEVWEDLLKDVKVPKTKPKKSRSKAGETYLQTYELIKTGMMPIAVATARELTIGTIYGHCLKGLEAGVLEIEELIPLDRLSEMAEVYKPGEDLGPYQLHQQFPKFDTGEWRIYLKNLNLGETS